MRRLAIIVVATAAAVAIDGATVSEVTARATSWLRWAPAATDAPVLAHAPPVVERPTEVAAAPLAVEPAPAVEDEWQEVDPEPSEELAVGAPEDDASDEPEPEAPAHAPPVLVSVARETWVYAEPRWSARRLGYLRAGAVVDRDPTPVTRQSCRGGWYRIAPRGYVCDNRAASLDPSHPVAQLSAERPLMGGLPYLYATSRYPTPPLYARLPSDRQQREVEPDLAGHLRKISNLQKNPDFTEPPAADPLPPLLADGAALPGLAGHHHGSAVALGRARVRSGFAMLGSYDHEGRRFGLTTELALIPLDRMRVVAPSTLRGVALSDEFTLPVAIVTKKSAQLFRAHPESGGLAHDGALTHRQVLSLTGDSRRFGGIVHHEVTGGGFVRDDQVRRIDGFSQAPKWARQGKKWIDVSILRQALVAYEGTRPVYATLVSTGADGLADHRESHATIQGTFLIHTKHVSVTMDGDDTGDEFDLRDVPFVQYFTEGYALHGAYWHDDFGRPRSHGCVNLAPVDAAWLFRWTDPELPRGWHAALSLKQGTVVYIHP
jgi:hypothetical protein